MLMIFGNISLINEKIMGWTSNNTGQAKKLARLIRIVEWIKWMLSVKNDRGLLFESPHVT